MQLVLRRREPLLTRAEVNGLIVLLMRLEANIARIAQEASGEDDGEEA